MKHWLVVAALAIGVVFTPIASASPAGAQAAGQRLVIPDLAINAPIVRVGLKKGGELAIGSSVTKAYTWRRGDPLSDPLGTTVIAVHAYRAGDGIGDHLGDLRRRTRIVAGGYTYKVTKVRVWTRKYAAKRLSMLYRTDGPARLVLVTCKSDDYRFRTVVFARKVD